MAMINMTPGIDWTKETLVLYTNSCVEHCAVEKDERTENWVKVDQQWGPGAYAINDCGEYLSVKFYRVEGKFYRVTDFKDDVAHNKHIGLMVDTTGTYYGTVWQTGVHTDRGFDEDLEMRIYKDRKMVVLHKITIDGKEYHYVYDNQESWWKKQSWGDITLKTFTANESVKIVTTDEEVAKYARILSKKSHSEFRRILYCEEWSDLDIRYIQDHNSYQCGYMSSKTRNAVEKFFDFDSDARAFLRSEFKKNEGGKGCGGSHIWTMKDIFIWCYSKDAASNPRLSKEERAAELLKNVQEEWDNPEMYKNEAIWKRAGDNIILAMPNTVGSSSWGYGDRCKKLFAYNVKTKVRFYGEQNPVHGDWTFPVPSLGYITTAMYLGEYSRYINWSTVMVSVKTVIKDGITARQLFDGTNIAWILDNTNGECKILNKDEAHSTKDLVPVDVRHYLTESKIGTIALSILVTTGIPMLEQLLKSKLFNIYFAAVEDLEARVGGHGAELFWDDDKKHASDYERKSAVLTYHSKEKNLKKMFGLSLQALREVDNIMVYKYGRTSRYSKEESWYRPMPTMSGMAEALNTDLTALDPATFGRCLALSLPNNGVRRRYSSEVAWSIVGDTVAKAVGPTATPKQVLALLENYSESLQEYRDYLNMRTQLMRIQEAKSDIPGIFSNKHYPVKPGTAKRFVPFLQGMPDTSRPWARTNFTEVSFIDHYKHKYQNAVSRGEFQVIRENGELLGLFICFTPNENLIYLHDEASYWVGFYQDSAKDELFKKAVERVKPLEWMDDKSGLCILAPQGVKDIKNEGTVLSHCVASYVDPIINGTDNIMFLRRTDMIDSPFYTVEVLDSGKIRQVHCYANGDLTNEGQRKAFVNSSYQVYDHNYNIVQFLLDWAKAMKGKIKASSIKSAYGALCALR